jgi:hypothetical protein
VKYGNSSEKDRINDHILPEAKEICQEKTTISD